MGKQEDSIFFKLHVVSDKDRKAFDKMLRRIFDYTTYHKKDNVDILNLIAKNECGKILENYLISLNDIQKTSLFYTAVESNCIELVNVMIGMQVNLQPHKIKELIDMADRCKYSEMFTLLKKSFPMKE